MRTKILDERRKEAKREIWKNSSKTEENHERNVHRNRCIKRQKRSERRPVRLHRTLLQSKADSLNPTLSDADLLQFIVYAIVF
jgi:hypothetical protein